MKTFTSAARTHHLSTSPCHRQTDRQTDRQLSTPLSQKSIHRKLNFSLLLFLFLMSTSLAIGQKNHWLLYPTHIDFSNGFSTNQVSFSQNTPYAVENSVYDVDGNLLFYVQNGKVIDPATSMPVDNSFGEATTKEIAIVPVPGSCDIYCVFHIKPQPLSDTYIYMQEVSMATGSPVILNQQFLSHNGQNLNITSNTGGIGVSPIIGGTDADRHIYFVGYLYIYKYLLDLNGLNLVSTIPSPIGYQENIAEAEISPDGMWLAWNNESQAVVMNLANNALFFTHDFDLPLTNNDYIKGLAFHPSEGNTYALFVSQMGAGVHRWYFEIPNNSPNSFPNTAQLDYTQLSKAADGNIYGVGRIANNYFGETGELIAISPINGHLTPTGIMVHSGGFAPTQSGFALPDQINGENEHNFYGVLPLNFDDLAINSTVLPMDVTSVVPDFYDCNPLNLNVPNDPMLLHDVEIVSVDPVTGLPLSGPIYLDYTSSSMVAPVADIRCWDNTNCDLFDNYLNQMFRLTYTITNKCEAITQVGFFNVQGAPDAAKNNFVMNKGNGSSCSIAEDINQVCGIGVYSANIDLSNSNGDITFYNIRIEEVDCNTGLTISSLYDGGEVAVNNISMINGLGINSFEINGSTGFFATNAVNLIGRCFLITTKVGNPCGSDENHAFVTFDGFYLSAPYQDGAADIYSGDIEKEKAKPITTSVQAYPNPANESIQITFSLEAAAESTLSIYNQAGKLVLEKSAHYAKGEHLITNHIQNMPSGVYIYRLQTGQNISSGKFIKL